MAFLATPRLVILDLDGVVYRGDEPVPGAVELVRVLHDEGVAVRFATNNSTATRAAYAAKLGRLGIPVEAREIVTSTSATIEHLRRHAPDVRRVLAVGAPGMVDELLGEGFEAVPAADAAPVGYDGSGLPDRFDAVVVGLDPDFDYRRLAAATSAIGAGARFIATNADRRFPTPRGFLPGAGAIVAAVAAAAQAEPLVIGKPEPAMFGAILEAAGVKPGHALVIGDNPDSDVRGAHRAGIASVLVLSGVTDSGAAAALDGERRPNAVVAGPGEVAGLLRLASGDELAARRGPG
jgi:phosphoglycolate/pyridoxal phosphate phosphatase family enzyme